MVRFSSLNYIGQMRFHTIAAAVMLGLTSIGAENARSLVLVTGTRRRTGAPCLFPSRGRRSPGGRLFQGLSSHSARRAALASATAWQAISSAYGIAPVAQRVERAGPPRRW